MVTTLSYQTPGDDTGRAPSPHRRRAVLWTLGVVAVLVVLGVSSCSYWLLGVGQRSQVVEHLDAFQVLARPGEAWLFLDIEKSVMAPGAIAGPPRGHSVQQLAIVFDEGGVRRQIPITSGTRYQTFNSNLSIVFGLDDGIYVLDRPSRLSRWNADHFEPVPEWSREAFAAVPDLAKAADYQEDEVLDAATIRSGWTPVAREHVSMGRAGFHWNGGIYIIDTDTTIVPAKVRLRRADDGHEWSADIAQYNGRLRPARRGE